MANNGFTSPSIQMLCPCIHIMLKQMKACGENLTRMTNVFALCLQPDLTRPEKGGSAHGPVSSHKSHVLTPKKRRKKEIFYKTCHDKTGIFSDGMDPLQSLLYKFIIALFIFGFAQTRGCWFISQEFPQKTSKDIFLERNESWKCYIVKKMLVTVSLNEV